MKTRRNFLKQCFSALVAVALAKNLGAKSLEAPLIPESTDTWTLFYHYHDKDGVIVKTQRVEIPLGKLQNEPVIFLGKTFLRGTQLKSAFPSWDKNWGYPEEGIGVVVTLRQEKPNLSAVTESKTV